MEVMKVAAAAIITAALYSVVKQLKPEMCFAVLLGGIMLICGVSLDSLLSVTGQAKQALTLSLIDRENVEILIKGLAICVITQLAANVCADNSCLSLASAVELCGKAMALAAALPLISAITSLAVGMLE